MSKRQEQKSDIGRNVLDRINSGEVTMHSRLYFMLISSAGLVAAFASAILLAYFVRVVTISLRIASADTPAYGARQNLEQLWASFPWWAAGLAIVCGALALWLLRRYGRLYRYRMSRIVIGFVAAVAMAGVLMSFVGTVHQPNSDFIDRGGMQRGKNR